MPMHQFDVVANPFPHSRGRQPFLVALQSDLLTQSFDTVVVAPLEPGDSRNFMDRLNPSIMVEGRSFVVVAQTVGHRSQERAWGAHGIDRSRPR
ncbi:MAG: CcdB family protein [Xanthobacteraceae bacterium]|nr:CcdB family protein [Xanthobacteraceae bacterium]MBV9626909.1 CcdB family protein [Xanthobacteraceae bacterium]